MKTKRFTISLPDDLYEALKVAAEAEYRTLGQEIAYLLNKYVPDMNKKNNKPGY